MFSHRFSQYPSGSRFSCSFAGEFQCRLKCLRERRDRDPHIIDIIQILYIYICYICIYTRKSYELMLFFHPNHLGVHKLMCNSYI